MHRNLSLWRMFGLYPAVATLVAFGVYHLTGLEVLAVVTGVVYWTACLYPR